MIDDLPHFVVVKLLESEDEAEENIKEFARVIRKKD